MCRRRGKRFPGQGWRPAPVGKHSNDRWRTATHTSKLDPWAGLACGPRRDRHSSRRSVAPPPGRGRCRLLSSRRTARRCAPFTCSLMPTPVSRTTRAHEQAGALLARRSAPRQAPAAGHASRALKHRFITTCCACVSSARMNAPRWPGQLPESRINGSVARNSSSVRRTMRLISTRRGGRRQQTKAKSESHPPLLGWRLAGESCATPSSCA